VPRPGTQRFLAPIPTRRQALSPQRVQHLFVSELFIYFQVQKKGKKEKKYDKNASWKI